MTVTANNDTAKSSAAGLSVADVASIVDVGGPYTIYRGWRDGTGYNLDASMTFGSQEFYWRKWLNEFGVDDWYFGLNYGAGDPMPGVISASSRTTLGTYALGLRAESVNGVDIVSDYTTVDILEVQSSLPIWSGSNTSLDGSTISSDQSNADAWKMVDGSLFDPAITVSQGNIIYITLSNSAFIQTKTLWMQTTTAQFLRCDVYIWQISSNSWVKVGQLFNTDTSGNGLSLIHFSNLINSKMYKLVLLNAPLPITIAQIGISEL